MNKETRDWIKLISLKKVGAVRGNALLKAFRTPQGIFSASADELKNVEGISQGMARDIIMSRDSMDIDGEIALIEKNKIDIVTLEDPRYPENLKNIYAPPLVLYVKGSLKPEDHHSIAVVGTRRASIYGMSNAEKFSYELAVRGFTVVSGLARGIDTYAHRGALKAKGRTIAVLGSGINVPYPLENSSLMDVISQNGAVISEFPMNTPPNKQNFPARNRIINGLSLGVLVVEAAKRSGALITASFALDEGREVFSLPGRVDSTGSKGTLSLIKQGAKLVEDINDILDEVKSVPPDRGVDTDRGGQDKDVLLKDDESRIFGVLSDEPKHLDDIKNDACLNFGAISEILLKLQIKGVVKELPGKKFIRS